jgi:hypothetical protein
MHVGRRLGNLLGKFCPSPLAGAPPQVPFLDIRLEDVVNGIVTIFVNVDRFELQTHLFANGEYRQTRAVAFTPVESVIYFDLEDTGGGSTFTAAIFRRDDPTEVLAFTSITLTGAGLVEANASGTVQSFTPLGGGWFRVAMDIVELMGDQFQLSFAISGGSTRVGAVQIAADVNGDLRKDLDNDLTMWSTPLAINGLTGSGVTAYDLLNGTFTSDHIWKFITTFKEQLVGVQRHTFCATYSGPNNSGEGPEIPARGILPATATNRVHLQWGPTTKAISEIVIEASQDGSAWSEFARVSPEFQSYVTPELAKGVWRFRLRAQDAAGNLSSVASIADFSPDIWFEPTDPANAFIDLLGLTQVLNDQDPIALMTNKGSTGGVTLEQPTLADRPLFDADAIDHGAGIRIPNAEAHMDGGAAGPWIGGGQEFDIFTALLLEGPIPATLPADSLSTTDYFKLFSFESYFELVVADFSDTFFTTPDSDFNTGAAIIARMQTGGGAVELVLPLAIHTINVIRASYDGVTLTLQVGSEVVSAAAAAPVAPTTVLAWGEPAPNKGLIASVGPLVVFPSLIPNPNDLLFLLGTDVQHPTAFIIPEVIQAPTGIQVSFAGLNGSISSAASPTPSVTEYRLYHNSGTLEFPDFTAPAATSPAPSFIIPMTAGLWRIVMRASDGTSEDGNFENRLDILVVENSPGILSLAGPPPNPMSQLELDLVAGGSVQLSGFYRAFGEQAVGVALHVWIFEQDTPIDLTDPPDAVMFIPGHIQGVDETFEVIPTTIGPFAQEVPHTLIARVRSDQGDYNIGGENVILFTPLSSSPPEPLGLKGNTC